MSERHGWHLSVLAVVLELELEHVLLDLRVPERLQNPSTVGAQEVVAHVGVEVEVVKVVDKISLLCCMFELLVVVAVRKSVKVRSVEFSFLLDDTNTISLTVRQITR